MVGKRRVFMVVCMVLVSLLLWGCAANDAGSMEGKNLEVQQGKVFKIGISQLVEHQALDSAREGFIDALASKGYKDGENLSIEFQNAQGDMATTQLIAQNFVSQDVDLIFAVATPSAQAAYNVTKDIPILMTAVTDPVEAGLVQSLEKPNTNVTGTSDIAPIEKQFELLKKLLPQAKRVGILYNSSEVNSEIQIKRAEEIAKGFSLEIIPTGITSVNEVPQALDALIGDMDVLYVPTDNLVASSMSLIGNQCSKKGVPIIGAEKAHVEAGALATEGIDYYQLGFQTGLMAEEIISGKNPQDIPIAIWEKTQLLINTGSAQKLGISIPEDIKEKAQFIEGSVED
ncbi:ABC transporter substrate-binding protein [Irregularibacter muris]|uniref:ABC transporter substrate-binding protein n=1 Tax=Irregularibacter muris TaxID=1796619 RepID=A0AAE3HDY1_9FIRM|nr:ABC transporter substrate-binding protein [Irregularibacter muris]MCR1898731.1 ABC transporter substrate-binding protein [Irregularibacter muris]